MGTSISTPWGGFSHQADHQKSFREPGTISDPKQSLQQLLMALDRLGQGISERGPSRLRSLSPQGGPVGAKPVQLAGIPFQIGGGLGTDPALQSEQLAMGNPFKYGPMGGAPARPKGGVMDVGDQGAPTEMQPGFPNPVQRRKVNG